MTLNVQVDDRVSEPLRRLLDLQGATGYKIAGVGVLEAVRDHLAARDQLPNSRGWPKTHFHDRARQQTFLRTNNFEATVHIALVGFATYATGKPEVIKPVNSKYLTIPARPEAYGRRAREFGDLVFRMVPSPNGGMAPALVRAEQTVFSFGRKRKDGTRGVGGVKEVGGEVFYWLARSVHPKPHPEAVPTKEALQAAAVSALQSYVDSL